MFSRFNAHRGQFLHIGYCVSIAQIFAFQKPLEVREGQFVAWLEFAIVLALLLNGVIGQVPKEVERVIIELLRTRPQIAFFVPVRSQNSVDRCHEDIAANVEFPVSEQQRRDVLLYKSTFSYFIKIFDSSDYVLSIALNRYAGAAISVLPRFNQPQTGVGAYLGRKSILGAVNVVGTRDNLLLVDLLRLAVSSNVPKETFLVRQLIVVFQMVVHFQLIYCDLF